MKDLGFVNTMRDTELLIRFTEHSVFFFDRLFSKYFR